MRSLLCVMLLMVAGSAWATVGGDDRLEVLGYEPVDGKLYWLLHRGGEVGGPPRLHFLALQGERPGQAQAVSSWYQGDQRAAERAFPERLAALQARLKATPAADLAGARLTVTHQDLRVCADAAKQPRTGDEARALVARWQAGDPDLDSPVCRLLGLQVAWGDFTGETWAEAWGGASLLSVRALPDARYALAVVRFVGQHFESGYAVERPVLLRRAAPAAAGPPPAGPDPRCAGLTVAPAPDPAVPGLAPGAWRATLDADGVAPEGWTTATAHRVVVDEVVHQALVVQGPDWARVAVGRAAPGGGLCVVALARDDFGGNGVQVALAEIMRVEAGALLVFRHERAFRGGPEESAWTGLALEGRRVRWRPEVRQRPTRAW